MENESENGEFHIEKESTEKNEGKMKKEERKVEFCG